MFQKIKIKVYKLIYNYLFSEKKISTGVLLKYSRFPPWSVIVFLDSKLLYSACSSCALF